MRYKQIYWTACFARGHDVLTKNGIKPIQDITNKDWVMSHDGWVRVKQLNEIEYSGLMVCFSTDASSEKIRCSADHEFLVLRETPTWVPAINLTKYDTLLSLNQNGAYEHHKITYYNTYDVEFIKLYCIETSDKQLCSFTINGIIAHNCRATSKTFLSILALFLQCIFMPGTKRFIVATYKVQAAKIANFATCYGNMA